MLADFIIGTFLFDVKRQNPFLVHLLWISGIPKRSDLEKSRSDLNEIGSFHCFFIQFPNYRSVYKYIKNNGSCPSYSMSVFSYKFIICGECLGGKIYGAVKVSPWLREGLTLRNQGETLLKFLPSIAL